MAQASAHAVLPSLVEVGVEVLVDLHVRLLNLGTCAALEVEVERFEDIPTQLEVPVP